MDCHLIGDKEEPIYPLLELILKVPRNTTHHTFTTYPYKTVVMFLSEANEALERISSLLKPTYLSNLSAKYNVSTKKIEINANVLRPDSTALPLDQKVDAILVFPQDRVKTVPLTAGAINTWSGPYDARGEMCGTLRCFVRGFDTGSVFEATSGSSIFISYPAGQKCPNCGNDVTNSLISICSRCGKQLPIV